MNENDITHVHYHETNLDWFGFWIMIGAIVIGISFGGKNMTIKEVNDPVAQQLIACSLITSNNVQSECIKKINVDNPD